MKPTPFCSHILSMGTMRRAVAQPSSIVALLDVMTTGFITVQWMVFPVYVMA